MTLSEVLKTVRSEKEEIQKVLEQLRNFHSQRFWFEYQQTLEFLIFSNRDFDSSAIIEFTLKELQTNLDPMVIIQFLDFYIEYQQLDYSEALRCIESVKEGFSKMKNALIFLNLLQLRQKLKAGELETFVTEVSVVEKEILQLRNCPKAIYAQLYKIKSEYLWRKKDYGSYFQIALRYIAYTEKTQLSLSLMLELSERCISSALVSDDLLSFNEITSSDLFTFLKTHDERHYLCEIALLFNAGKIEELKKAIEQNMFRIKNSTIEPFLEKITKNVRVIALCDHIFLSPQRFTYQNFNFQDISLIAKVPFNEVETLLIYILSTDMMKGYIDQVGQVFHVHSVKPRVLDLARIGQLKEKFQAWNANVSKTLSLVSSY